MLNRVSLMGRMVHDPELKNISGQNGPIPVVSFTIAVERDFKNESGERQADFFDCTAWRKTAEFVCKYFQKGSSIAIDGRLQSRDYTDAEGKKRRRTEVVVDNAYFADSKKDDSPNRTSNTPRSKAPDEPQEGGDLPF